MKGSVFCLILLLERMNGLDLKAWLKRLDDRICRSLDKGYGNGTNMLQAITTYNGYLYHLSNTDQEWTVDHHRKLEKVLNKRIWLGPKYLTVNYSLTTLKVKLKMIDYEVKELEKLLEETKCLFAEVENK